MAKELRDDSDYIKTKLLKHSLFVDSNNGIRNGNQETLTVHRMIQEIIKKEVGVGYK